MITRYGAAFRGAAVAGGHSWNLFDALNQGVSGSWTNGQTLEDQVNFRARSSTSVLTALSLSVTAQLALRPSDDPSAINPAALYGKYGAIMCGISTEGPLTPAPSAATLGTTTLKSYPLPRDNSLITTLWDPAQDPLPPLLSVPPPATLSTIPPALNVGASIQLPQPLRVPNGSSIYAGIWMLPSLISGAASSGAEVSWALCVFDAQYVFTYDDTTGEGIGPLPHA